MIEKIVNEHKSIILNKNSIIKGSLSKAERSVISKDISRVTNHNILRRSLEPLKINTNLSESDTSNEKHSTLNFAKVTRTGFIPLCAETGFKKKQNQDASVVIQNYLGIPDVWFLGVFDGHGINGGKVSNMIKKLIPDFVSHYYHIDGVISDGLNPKFSTLKLETINSYDKEIESSNGSPFKTMSSWLANKNNDLPKVEKLKSLKTRAKAFDEAMTHTQKELK